MKKLKDLKEGHLKAIQGCAEDFRILLGLQYDADSVKTMEELIENKRKLGPNKYDRATIMATGFFLGQCIILNFGGRWRLDTESDSAVVYCNDRLTAYPHSKVWKQFNNGLEDSIYGFYCVISEVSRLLKEGKTAIEIFPGIGQM